LARSENEEGKEWKIPMTPRRTILVVGSLNMDFIVQVSKLPSPGETIIGRGFQMLPGGKGANQAYAASRLGGETKIIGRVGDDLFGERLRFNLESIGVDTVHLMSTANEPTGTAMILVENGGQNQIVITAGANACLSPSDLELASASFQEGFLMLQLESPIETLEAAAALGKKRGMTTILDPAPARSLSSSLLRHIDVLTPNESEALHLLGRSPGSIPLAGC
jgi:ribokinase